MMANLEPSVEITGGPWYTDNELDVEFIRMLSSACLQYIRDRVSFSSFLFLVFEGLISRTDITERIAGCITIREKIIPSFESACVPERGSSDVLLAKIADNGYGAWY